MFYHFYITFIGADEEKVARFPNKLYFSLPCESMIVHMRKQKCAKTQEVCPIFQETIIININFTVLKIKNNVISGKNILILFYFAK